STGSKRQLNIGDHVRVVGRWVIDHHPEWCDEATKLTPPEPARCLFVDALKIGAAHVELHPIRWDDIELVDPAAKVTVETVSLAAPLHEHVFVGGGKWLANELALVASKIFVNDVGSNYHNTMTARADINYLAARLYGRSVADRLR